MSKFRLKTYEFSSSIKQEIDTLLVLDNWHGIVALLEDYFFIGISIFVTYWISWYFYPLAILIIGARQRALATILHESAHGVLVKNKYLNFILGSFFSGYLILQTMTSYKESHIRYHHGHFGDPEQDSDYKFMVQEGLYNENITPKNFIIQNVYLPMILSKLPKYLHSLFLNRFWNTKCKENFIILFFLLAIILICIYYNWGKLIIIFWLIPYFTTFQIIGWFIELCEHYPLMKNKCSLYMSRNRHSHWLEKFFTGIHHENYHLIHHLNMSIPFWNMPKAHKILLQDRQYEEWDKLTGGIFISSNYASSIIKKCINYLQQNVPM